MATTRSVVRAQLQITSSKDATRHPLLRLVFSAFDHPFATYEATVFGATYRRISVVRSLLFQYGFFPNAINVLTFAGQQCKILCISNPTD